MDEKNAPCRECTTDRHPGCQTDACDRWKAWHDRQQQRKSQIFKKRWLDAALRKVGRKKPRESHTARVLQGKSHRKERQNGSRMEMEQAPGERFREEIRQREE